MNLPSGRSVKPPYVIWLLDLSHFAAYTAPKAPPSLQVITAIERQGTCVCRRCAASKNGTKDPEQAGSGTRY